MSNRPEIGQRLRDLADRPIEKPHPRLALALILLVVGAAIGLNLVTFPVTDPKPPPPAAAGAPAASPTPAVAPEVPADTAQVKVRDLRAAKRVATRFLHGYLPYTYGQRSASRVKGASAGLIKVLKAVPPRQPTGHRAHPARPVITVMTTSENATSRMVSFDAQITDAANRGAVSYNVPVTTELVGRRWVVTNAG